MSFQAYILLERMLTLTDHDPDFDEQVTCLTHLATTYATEVAGHKIHKVSKNGENIFVDYRGQFEGSNELILDFLALLVCRETRLSQPIAQRYHLACS